MKDRELLIWIHERLEHVYHESPLVDYMHKLRTVISSIPGDRETNNTHHSNTLEELLEILK